MAKKREAHLQQHRQITFLGHVYNLDKGKGKLRLAKCAVAITHHRSRRRRLLLWVHCL